MNTRRQQGFTLYELLVTLLVIGVILSLGVPNLQEFTRNGRLTATANDLHSSFLLARSEAARLPSVPATNSVTICGSLTPMVDATAACDGNFSDGWIVFVDADGDIVRDAGEAILRAYPAIDTTLSLSTNGGATYFSFGTNGLGRGDVNPGTNGPSLVSASVCDSRGNAVAAGNDATARAVVATPIGRATVLRDHTQVGQQIANNGLSCP